MFGGYRNLFKVSDFLLEPMLLYVTLHLNRLWIVCIVEMECCSDDGCKCLGFPAVLDEIHRRGDDTILQKSISVRGESSPYFCTVPHIYTHLYVPATFRLLTKFIIITDRIHVFNEKTLLFVIKSSAQIKNSTTRTGRNALKLYAKLSPGTAFR